MKKISLIVILLIIAFVLTGCIKVKQTTVRDDGGIFKSVDVGENWHQKVFISRSKSGINTIGTISTSYMQYDPRDYNIIYLITSGNGIYKTMDRAETWAPTSLSSGTYPSIAFDPTNNDIVYTIKGSTIIKSTDGMKEWDTIYVEQRPRETITSLAIDPFSTNRIYATTKTSLLKSSDYGNTWQVVNWLSNNTYQLYINQKDTKILYLVTKTSGILKSSDEGKNWKNLNIVSKKSTAANKINSFYYESNSDLMLIATDAGLFKSTDGGENWTPINTLTKGLTFPTAAINPQNQNEIYYTIGHIIYKTVDGGTTWKTITTIPTSRAINFILVDPQSPSNIYLGTAAPPQK